MKYIFLVIIFTINCLTSSAGLTTSNIPVANKPYKVTGSVEADTNWFSLDFIFFGFPLGKPRAHELIQEKLKSENADAFINIHYWNDKIVLLFFNVHRFGFNAESIKFEEVNNKNESKKTR